MTEQTQLDFTQDHSAITDNIIKRMLIEQGKNLSEEQLRSLRDTLELTLSKYNIQEDYTRAQLIDIQENNVAIIRDFINAKKIEGRSNATLYNYAKEITKLFMCLNKPCKDINSADIRDYLAYRKQSSNLTNTTVANIRMTLISFFKWCLIEDIIHKNPMDRIGVIKCETKVIDTLTDEEAEIIRCACESERDLAIIDLLTSSGMRVSELVALNIQDIDFEKGEVKVFGKGSKERICFITGKAKVHLKWYIESRVDDNEALFVTAKKPYSRITKNGVEYLLRCIAKRSKIPTVRLYPHKYRSTLATNMINKGAKVEDVSKILGHSNSSTTLGHYANISTDRIHMVHKNYS